MCTALADGVAGLLNCPVEGTKRVSLTEKAHAAIAPVLKDGDIAIDATVGNGRDTKFLAGAVGESGHVYGFDIQAKAIASAREFLAKAGLMRRVTLFEAGHERMREILPPEIAGKVKVIMFNLGYLPGGSHDVTTMTTTTLAALDAALGMCSQNGILSILCYPGHTEGAKEYSGVERWAALLNHDQYEATWTESVQNTLNPSPRLLLITRKL